MTRHLDRIGRRLGRHPVAPRAPTRSASAWTPATPRRRHRARRPRSRRSSAITGRIDLVHANDSRDDFDSGADRHANFGAGHVDPDGFAEVIRTAGAPVICETPGGAEEHRADFAWLRERL
ncbi:MAG: TIM barrel protein [Propionicimonas sp.]|uniref:TIM barrel protein n=1 Tax=Propionicimonas sp. TaxID=1955623 RepID=UPI003D13F9EE